MSKTPDGLRYAKSHEWVRVSEGVATVGITDHAQNELTDVVFVELPAKGRHVAANEACAVVESVKTASDIYSPAAGEVIETNQAIVDDPSIINADAFGRGWFFKLRLSNPSDVDALLTPELYRRQIGG